MMDTLQHQLETGLAGRYHLERELGQGGMAVVFLAQDLRHDRMVALKVLRPDLSAAIGAERFLREIKLAAGLNHPHILPALGFRGFFAPRTTVGLRVRNLVVKPLSIRFVARGVLARSLHDDLELPEYLAA